MMSCALVLVMCSVTHLGIQWCSSDASVYMYSMHASHFLFACPSLFLSFILAVLCVMCRHLVHQWYSVSAQHGV